MTAGPARVQRTRKKDARLPAGARYVGRGTPFGNPFAVVKDGSEWWVHPLRDGGSDIGPFASKWDASWEAVVRFLALAGTDPDWLARIRHTLGGETLACYCPLTDTDGERFPCHGDVLLVLANPGLDLWQEVLPYISAFDQEQFAGLLGSSGALRIPLPDFPAQFTAVDRDGFDLVRHLRAQHAFSQETFGPSARVDGIVQHIRDELVEVAASPNDLTEWVDVVLLAFDGALRQGFTATEIAAALGGKLAKNQARTWSDWRTADPGKPITHVKSSS